MSPTPAAPASKAYRKLDARVRGYRKPVCFRAVCRRSMPSCCGDFARPLDASGAAVAGLIRASPLILMAVRISQRVRATGPSCRSCRIYGESHRIAIASRWARWIRSRKPRLRMWRRRTRRHCRSTKGYLGKNPVLRDRRFSVGFGQGRGRPEVVLNNAYLTGAPDIARFSQCREEMCTKPLHRDQSAPHRLG